MGVDRSHRPFRGFLKENHSSPLLPEHGNCETAKGNRLPAAALPTRMSSSDPDVFPRPGPDPAPDPDPNPIPLPPADPDPEPPFGPLPTPSPVY
jgi:hypothetical protein